MQNTCKNIFLKETYSTKELLYPKELATISSLLDFGGIPKLCYFLMYEYFLINVDYVSSGEHNHISKFLFLFLFFLDGIRFIMCKCTKTFA